MRQLSLFICLLFTLNGLADGISSDQVIQNKDLLKYLKPEIQRLISDASEQELASYFREQFSERFFYDYENVDQRYQVYDSLYHQAVYHRTRAFAHTSRFADSARWILPSTDLNGEPINAYALRHLARQHKMVDVALNAFHEGSKDQSILYFTNQLSSLNSAFHSGNYEKIADGNGVYEAFRSGYRVLNWLSIHNLFLSDEHYTDAMQLTTIATLLQHGAHLYESNQSFNPGNHQTRGMSALAMLSILFRDFEGTDQWYEHSMQLLEEHLNQEINHDGFQFERSVHYHISDIENYFFVYSLAQKSEIEVGELWRSKLRQLFETLVMIAYPDGSAPVLQDDTDNPWAEKNEISEALTIGYLLFDDPNYGYFADSRVSSKMFWFFDDDELIELTHLKSVKPIYGSIYFPDTKYGIMRSGWDVDDRMMVVSAGLDDKKPDHQHGDMLGIQAMAYGHVVLPNYQVRYSLPDYEFFKNSMVKNVALVDDVLQGKMYRGNKGGSGFGKFGKLPQPNTIVWDSNENFDLFIGSHDGFEDAGVNYSRQLIFIDHQFWIVKDNFSSEQNHSYKQVWQGHYVSEAGSKLLRSTFDDAAGCDIYQFLETDTVYSGGTRGKQWNVVESPSASDFSFITSIYPFDGYLQRVDESESTPNIGEWQQNILPFHANGHDLTTLSRNREHYLFNVDKIDMGDWILTFEQCSDIYLQVDDEQVKLFSLNVSNQSIRIEGKGIFVVDGIEKGVVENLKPGDNLIVKNR